MLYSVDSEPQNTLHLSTRITLNKQLDQVLLTKIVEFGFTKAHSVLSGTDSHDNVSAAICSSPSVR